MIAEALKYLADLKEQALKPLPLGLEDPWTARFAVGDKILEFDNPIPSRNHDAGNLAEIIALANRFAKSSANSPVVWYDESSVVLVIDDGDRRIDRATLTLERSDVFKLLVSLRNNKQWYEPRPFVRMLRVELAGTLAPWELLEKVRNIKFDNGVVTTAKLGRADESLGRTINSKVSGEGEIPEEVVLQAPVFKTPGETDRLPCRCSVDVDPAMGKLQLLPLPDEIERVLAMAVTLIGERLTEGLDPAVPCYFGKP